MADLHAAPSAARFEVRATAADHFAWIRTRLALERTIMSWLRTAVALIGFGFRGKTLRRHLGTRHGLQTAEYLRRWDLASDHPLTAPAYSEQRSTMAKELGLGRKRSRPRGRPRRVKG
jgi:hypothetical protein